MQFIKIITNFSRFQNFQQWSSKHTPRSIQVEHAFDKCHVSSNRTASPQGLRTFSCILLFRMDNATEDADLLETVAEATTATPVAFVAAVHHRDYNPTARISYNIFELTCGYNHLYNFNQHYCRNQHVVMIYVELFGGAGLYAR